MRIYSPNLDAGVKNLKRVQANLKRYKASVLKAACEGRLVETEAELARREGREYEPADKLLERILKERRKRWEEEQRAKGKDPAKMTYKEPEPPDTEGLPELPEGWCWATWAQLSPRVTVGHVGKMKDEYVEKGIPFLRSQNVRENKFDENGLVYISKVFHNKLEKSKVKPGDLVVVRSGSVGVTCVIPESIEEGNCSDLVIIQKPMGMVPLYGSYYMNSLALEYVKSKTVGVALRHFNTMSVAENVLPLPPVSEQIRIVEEVQVRLDAVERVISGIGKTFKRSEQFRESVLRKAFTGILV